MIAAQWRCTPCDSCIECRPTVKAINDERRLNAQIISYRKAATLAQFRWRNGKQDSSEYPCLDQFLEAGAGGSSFHHGCILPG
jgi:hypothetical protein